VPALVLVSDKRQFIGKVAPPKAPVRMPMSEIPTEQLMESIRGYSQFNAALGIP